MLEKRPTIIMAVWGSFIAGYRENLAAICESYAKKGYVAVTIDYRLFDGPIFPVPSASIMKDVVVKAIGDYRAAIRFMKEDAATTNTFRVDANYIMVGGISAGALAASHAAVLDESDPIPDDLLEIISM